jgi:hypothetical protein
VVCMGLKPSDAHIVPLSWKEHKRQHEIGEKAYWGRKLEYAKELASALFLCTGNYDMAAILLARFSKK